MKEPKDQMSCRDKPNSESAPVDRIVHTPGPWSVAKWQGDEFAYNSEVVAGNGEKVVSIVREGDAKVIAAAPDMYRLIRKCYEVLHTGVWINYAMWNHFGDAWRPKADEAV
jgi:hypothetical protein